MTQSFATIELSDVATFDMDTLSLTFIQDVDYEFVGGGTAFNGL